MTHHERATLADRCARCDGIPDSQALLAEMRAQVEEARRERDEARDTARLLGEVLGRYTTQRRCRLAALLWRSARSRRLRERLHDAEVAAEQALLAEKSLAAEKAALLSRVAVLEEALRGLSSDLDRVLAMRSTLGRTEWLTTIAEKARRALEVRS